MTKERPILFSTEMVKAILDGKKTQTRRIVKDDLAACPYGEPGDILWVRETWAHLSDYQGTDPGTAAIASGYFYRQQTPDAVEKWRPSIFMPRKACRILLKVEDVRTERLQEITQDEARLEGISQPPADCIAGFKTLWDGINGKRGYPWDSDPLVWVIEFTPTHQY
jgi:hypothetical protein